jgi:hypothetical protein
MQLARDAAPPFTDAHLARGIVHGMCGIAQQEDAAASADHTVVSVSWYLV